MEEKKIRKEVITLISDLFEKEGFDVDGIEYVDFVDDFGIDSITFISLIVTIETHFDIEISDDVLSFENLRCLDEFISIVWKEVSSGF